MTSFNHYFNQYQLYGQLGLLDPNPALQCNKIGSLVINNQNWKYLSDLDQYVSTDSNVQFVDGNFTGTLSLYDANVTNDLDVGNDATIDRDLYVSRDGIFTGNISGYDLDVSHDLNVDNDAFIDANASVGGTLSVDTIDEFGVGNGVGIMDITVHDSYISDCTTINEMNMSGFTTWEGSAPHYSISGVTFSLLNDVNGFIKGHHIVGSAAQTIDLVAHELNIIYIDSSGILGVSDVKTQTLYTNNIMLLEIFYDGTVTISVTEAHPYSFQTEVSNYLQDAVGPILGSHPVGGGNMTVFGTNQIKITTDMEVMDHGLLSSFPGDSNPITISYCYTNNVGQWIVYSTTDTMPEVYNNVGTVTTLSSSAKFGVYTIYTIKDDINSPTTRRFIGVINSAQFDNDLAASNAIADGLIAAPTLNLYALEPVQLGYIIFKLSGITKIEIAKRTLQSSISTGGATSSHILLSEINGGTYGCGNHRGMCQEHESTSVPTATDDITAYLVGCNWIKTDTDQVYICVDNTLNTAVWRHIPYNGGVSDFTSITVDHIDEHTGSHGVVVDGMTIKDGAITNNSTGFGMKLAAYATIQGIGIQSGLMEFITNANSVDFRWGYGTSGSLTETMFLDNELKRLYIDKVYSAYTITSGDVNTPLVYTDTINEKTAAHGVIVDGLTIKDGKLYTGATLGLQVALVDANRGLGLQTNVFEFIQNGSSDDFRWGYGASGSLTQTMYLDSGTKTLSVDNISTDHILELTAGHGVNIDGIILKDNNVNASVLYTDTITELTSAAGVSIEGVTMKDSIIGSNLKTIAIGYGSINTGILEQVAIGGGDTYGEYGIAIGVGANASSRCISIGRANNTSATGLYNISIGWTTGFSMTSGAVSNTLVGGGAGYLISDGDNNSCYGQNAGNTITTGSNCVCIGVNSDGIADGDNQIAIGSSVACTAANTVRIGNSSITDNYFNGNTTLLTGGIISSGSTLGMKLAAYGTTYGIGVQASMMEFISNGDYRWGVGTSGSLTTSMFLDASEKLLQIDHITELTSAHGVDIEGITMKDSIIGSNLTDIVIGSGSLADSYDISIGVNAGSSSSLGNVISIGENAGNGTPGNDNVLLGTNAGTALANTGGDANYNVCVGYNAGNTMSTGNKNIYIGYQAGDTSTTGVGNMCVGYNSDCTEAGTNQMALGYDAVCTASNSIVLGNTSHTSCIVHGIYSTNVDVPVAVNLPVHCMSNGQLNTRPLVDKPGAILVDGALNVYSYHTPVYRSFSTFSDLLDCVNAASYSRCNPAGTTTGIGTDISASSYGMTNDVVDYIIIFPNYGVKAYDAVDYDGNVVVDVFNDGYLPIIVKPTTINTISSVALYYGAVYSDLQPIY